MAQADLHDAYRLRFEDWARFPDDGRLYELIGGELFVNPAPNVRHQRVSRELERALADHLEETGRGEVFDAPIGVRLSDHDVPEPDLVVVLSEHADRVGEDVIDGPPDLVVEILSPGSAQRDVGEKKELYARSGIPEYWVVDPVRDQVDVLRLDGAEYALWRRFGASETLTSPLLPDLSIGLAKAFVRKA